MSDDPHIINTASSSPDFSVLGGAGEEPCLEARLRGEEKRESLSIMAGGVAHHINNMLMPIVGYLRLARTQISAGSPVASYLEQIEIATKRLARLSRDMLAYTGKGKNRIETLDISGLIGTLELLLATIVVKPVELTYLLTQDIPPVQADRSQLRRVVTALVTNAVEAIGDNKGVVTIRTGVSETDHFPETTLKGESISGSLLVFLEVADTGCGIPTEDMEKIFDPFFSTKFVGRGLGLAAVHGIVRGHGGTIRVESRPGEETAFRIFLPVAPPPSQKREKEEPAQG